MLLILFMILSIFFFNVWFHIWSQEVARQKTIHLLWLWRGEFPEFGRSPPLWRNTFPRTQSPFDARTHLDQGLSKRDVRSWTTIAFVPKGYNVSCVSFLFFFPLILSFPPPFSHFLFPPRLPSWSHFIWLSVPSSSFVFLLSSCYRLACRNARPVCPPDFYYSPHVCQCIPNYMRWN